MGSCSFEISQSKTYLSMHCSWAYKHKYQPSATVSSFHRVMSCKKAVSTPKSFLQGKKIKQSSKWFTWKTSSNRQYEWLYHCCTRFGSFAVLQNYPSELYFAQVLLKYSQILSSYDQIHSMHISFFPYTCSKVFSMKTTWRQDAAQSLYYFITLK